MKATIIAISTLAAAIGIWLGLHTWPAGADTSVQVAPVRYELVVSISKADNPDDTVSLAWKKKGEPAPVQFDEKAECQAVQNGDEFRAELKSLLDRFDAAGVKVVAESACLPAPDDGKI